MRGSSVKKVKGKFALEASGGESDKGQASDGDGSSRPNSSDDSDDDSEDAFASRRLKRMRHLEPNKAMVILMPKDNPVHVLGLEKNEMEEFQGCLEEVYEWIPEKTKADAHGDHGKSHGGIVEQPNLPAKLSSGGFNFNVARRSSHDYGGTAIAKSTLPLSMIVKVEEDVKESKGVWKNTLTGTTPALFHFK